MTSPRPDVIERQLDAMRDLLRERPTDRFDTAYRGIADQYRWLYFAGLGTSNSQEVKVAVGGSSDPTANVAVGPDKVRMREATRRAARLIREAAANLTAADSILERATSGGMSGTSGVWPRTISDDELDATRQAKRRREQRGEGWGDG